MAQTDYTTNALNQYSAISYLPSSNSNLRTHDPDGNLTDNGTWSFTWNGENRLMEATDGSTTVEYTYDYQGRLVKRDDGTDAEVHVYDGWNRIATYEVQPSSLNLQTSYLWGQDLSGSQQGAGGVGGLLKEGNLYPTYDANGNIVQKLNSSGVAVMAVEYDPFGNIISGSLSGDYGFSTKPVDAQTGLLYYGFRYYDPVTGRWPSRDPIGEQGGLNLYGFVGNDGVNWVDVLGLIIPRERPNVPFPRIPRTSRPRRVWNHTTSWTPWYRTSHEMDIEFPSREYSNMEKLLDKIYNDLKVFRHFSTPSNDGGSVRVQGTTAKFSAPSPLNLAQGASSLVTSLTYYNVVTLSFDDSNKTVTGVTEPGHILEGKRYWNASILRDNPCGIRVRTWARERSATLLVEVTRRLDSRFGPDFQRIVWNDYLKNIGHFWKSARSAKVSNVR